MFNRRSVFKPDTYGTPTPHFEGFHRKHLLPVVGQKRLSARQAVIRLPRCCRVVVHSPGFGTGSPASDLLTPPAFNHPQGCASAGISPPFLVLPLRARSFPIPSTILLVTPRPRKAGDPSPFPPPRALPPAAPGLPLTSREAFEGCLTFESQRPQPSFPLFLPSHPGPRLRTRANPTDEDTVTRDTWRLCQERRRSLRQASLLEALR